MKSIIVFCVIVLCAGQAAAAIKNCEELKSEIAAKLVANGVSSFALDIVDKGWTGPGRIIGRCQGGTKRIVRLPVATSLTGPGQADTPSLPAITFAYGVKDCEDMKTEIAGKLVAAGVFSFALDIVGEDWTGAGKVIGSCENGGKKIVHTTSSGVFGAGQSGQPSKPAVSLAYDAKDCGELKSEISAKLIGAGISPSVLAIVDKERVGAEKVIGSCENGTKRIVRIRAADAEFGARQTDMPSFPTISFAYGIKDCRELKSEIAAKIIANGVPTFILHIVDNDWGGPGKIIGSCENGTKRIVRRKDLE